MWWEPSLFKRVILEEISSTVLKLEAHIVLNIPDTIIFEVADTLDIVEKNWHKAPLDWENLQRDKE